MEGLDVFAGGERLKDSRDTKVLILLGAGGPRALRLEGHAVASALLSLSSGKEPSGPELESIPEWAECVVKSLQERGRGWALLSTPEEQELEPEPEPIRIVQGKSEIEHGADFSAPLKAQLQELLEGFTKKTEAESDTYTRLSALVERFLADSEGLETLFPEVQCGIAHTLGTVLGHKLADEMGYFEGDLPGFQSDASQQNQTESPNYEVWDRLEEATSSESLAIILSPSEVVLRRKPFRDRLVAGIRKLRLDFYRDVGFLLPEVVLRYPEGFGEATVNDSIPPIEPGEYVVARRRQVIHCGRFPDVKLVDQVAYLLDDFEQVVRASAGEWLTHHQVDYRLQLVNKEEPALVDDFFRLGGSITELRRLLIEFLGCGFHIKDMHTILEVCLDHAPEDRLAALVERFSGSTWV